MEKVERYGSGRMAEIVVELKQTNESLFNMCVDNANGVDVSKLKDPNTKRFAYKPSGVSVSGFNIKANATNRT